MDLNLKGKKALVTGGTHGIGLCIAIELAKEGCDIALFSRTAGRVAETEKISVVGVDIGGATTDVFSVFQGQFNRTVSANLGMSYSVCNVLAESGFSNVARWVPFEMDEIDLTNRIGNKMIRPTTVPQ